MKENVFFFIKIVEGKLLDDLENSHNETWKGEENCLNSVKNKKMVLCIQLKNKY